MSSGKTERYELPQFAPNDHPDFLTDFNNAFKIIDEALEDIGDESSANDEQITSIREAIVTINESIASLSARVAALESEE